MQESTILGEDETMATLSESERLDIALKALSEIAKGLDGAKPAGNPWNFYQDLVDYAARTLEALEDRPNAG